MRRLLECMVTGLMVAASGTFAQPTNPAPGELRWSIPVNLVAGPTLGTNRVVYGLAQDGKIYAWEATNGQTRWSTNIGGPIYTYDGPLLVGPEGHVYVNSRGGLHALDGENGREVWRHAHGHGGSLGAVGADGTVFLANGESLRFGRSIRRLEPSSGCISAS